MLRFELASQSKALSFSTFLKYHVLVHVVKESAKIKTQRMRGRAWTTGQETWDLGPVLQQPLLGPQTVT